MKMDAIGMKIHVLMLLLVDIRASVAGLPVTPAHEAVVAAVATSAFKFEKFASTSALVSGDPLPARRTITAM